MQAKQFLDIIFEHKPPPLFTLIWQKKPDIKVSTWHQIMLTALDVIKTAQDHDVYVGCGVARNNLGPHRRAKMSEIVGIPGLWLDIDLFDPDAHKKHNLPADIETATDLVSTFPLLPTITIHSGHGLQYWWIFDEFYSFGRASENAVAATLLHDFTWSMRAYARQRGFEIDMTFDLSRVFRIPGTNNCKTNKPVPVRIFEMTGKKYALDLVRRCVEDLKQLAPKVEGDDSRNAAPVSMSIGVQEASENALFLMDSEAEPPALKFSMLLEVEPRFKASWDLKRQEFKDQSPSSYDYSLATFALQSGWTWQETVNLLIAFRRTRNLPQKLRYDYYYRTLAKASETINKSLAEERIDEILTDIVVDTKANPVTHNQKAAERSPDLLNGISEIFGVRITRIVRYKTDPPEYRLETPQGNVALGPIQNLIEQNLLRRKIADATKHFIPPIKKDRWAPIAQALLNASIDEDIGEEATDTGSFICSAPSFDSSSRCITRRATRRRPWAGCSKSMVSVRQRWRSVVPTTRRDSFRATYGTSPSMTP
jgi:hypothetical protein